MYERDLEFSLSYLTEEKNIIGVFKVLDLQRANVN